MICPTQMGWPGRRKRLYTISVLFPKLDLRHDLSSSAFEQWFYAKLCASADLLLKDDAETQARIKEMVKSMAKRRHGQTDDNPAQPEEWLAPGILGRLRGYQLMALTDPQTDAASFIVCNVSQNPHIIKAISYNIMPTLVRESCLWVLKSDKLNVKLSQPRLLAPSEMIASMGWHRQSSFSRLLPRLTDKQCRNMMGNGMNLRVVSALLLYALASTSFAE